jgi:hypothetical protein
VVITPHERAGLPERMTRPDLHSGMNFRRARHFLPFGAITGSGPTTPPTRCRRAPRAARAAHRSARAAST